MSPSGSGAGAAAEIAVSGALALDERRSLKQAGYNMPDWDPKQWLGCGSCQADHSDMDEQRGGSGEFKSPA